MDPKRPAAPGWRLSSIGRTRTAHAYSYRKTTQEGDWVVLSGVDMSAGMPAYRLLVVLDKTGDKSGLYKPNDTDARQILEEFQMLDAMEQPNDGGIGRGFFKWANAEGASA